MFFCLCFKGFIFLCFELRKREAKLIFFLLLVLIGVEHGGFFFFLGGQLCDFWVDKKN